MKQLLNVPPETILHHTSDGIYVVDPDCRILFWNQPAERLTGWKAEEVVGHRCSDDILVHVDRQGNSLCEPKNCPLHHAMRVGKPSDSPVLVWARCRDGSRIPVAVSVSPLRDETGKVIGGVEVFRDESLRYQQLRQARRVQQHILPKDLPQIPVCFYALYRPRDEVGGDYYRVEELPGQCFAFIVADVSGHGLPAALYTMTLHSLWLENASSLPRPGEFLTRLNYTLSRLITGDSFTTAFVGMVDRTLGELTYCSAGHPATIMRRPDGQVLLLPAHNLALGMLPETVYKQDQIRIPQGSLILIYSDGAVEAQNPEGEPFGEERLVSLVADAQGHTPPELLSAVERAILAHTENPLLDDDLTLLAITQQEC